MVLFEFSGLVEVPNKTLYLIKAIKIVASYPSCLSYNFLDKIRALSIPKKEKMVFQKIIFL